MAQRERERKRENMEQFKGQSRLPIFAVPKQYDIKLKPNLSACTFAGTLEITLGVVQPTKFLVLNAVDLLIDNSSITFKGTPFDDKVICRPSEILLNEDDEILVLGFQDFLPLGEGVLGISFEGTLNDKMRGFYRSTYEYKGEKKNMAVTQFEAADARRCFPCWDEPAFKATFKITLEVPSELVALSNMPVVEEKFEDHLKIISFQESPVMSTYLVAVVIGLFDYVEALTPDGIRVRVYCQVGKATLGKFALDVAVKTLDLYKTYFSIPYSLPKLDMVAIPDSLGAMENYGLVTYRETVLLYDDLHSAAANKQSVAIVVAHELAHQWFGNLVTMEWWTHLWLNEGFATWISFLAAESLFPDWKVWTQFLQQSVEGLRLDGLAESHPIEVEINHAREIDEIFDAISYKKGASVIRMLHNYLGAEPFQRSLASYIARYAHSNAKTEDLWAVLEEESGEPVKVIMNSWTKQKGYPVVYVKIRDDKLVFEQSQFLLSGLHGDGKWIVPITVCCGSHSTQKSFLLQTESKELVTSEVMGSPNTESCFQEKGGQGNWDKNNSRRLWVKLNVGQTGFYRVKYDDELAARLKFAVEAGQLSATDRFGVLDDSFALCMACKQKLSSLLSLMDAYREEVDYTVLSYLINVSYKILVVAGDAIPESSDAIKLFFINLLQFSAGKLGWENRTDESHLDAMLRGEMYTALAEFGHDLTQEEAVRRFYTFLDDRNTRLLPPDMRKAAYIAVMRTASNSNRHGYESLLRIYRETDLSLEKARILSSLASSPDPDLVLEVLNFLLCSEVRSQDIYHGLAGIRHEGREIAWRWLKDNWDHISKTWSGFLSAHIASSIVSPLCSDEKAEEVEQFFSSHVNPSMARTLKQSIERIKINAKWAKNIKNEKGITEIVTELAYRRY